jgi:hypothetical protein
MNFSSALPCNIALISPPNPENRGFLNLLNCGKYMPINFRVYGALLREMAHFAQREIYTRAEKNAVDSRSDGGQARVYLPNPETGDF